MRLTSRQLCLVRPKTDPTRPVSNLSSTEFFRFQTCDDLGFTFSDQEWSELRRLLSIDQVGVSLYSYIWSLTGFFTPIPCADTCLPLDGLARNYISNYFYLHGYARSHNLSRLDPIYSYLLITKERRKTFGLSWNQIQDLLLHKQPL